MEPSSFWERLEALPWVEHIAITWWFPFLESVHVLAVAILVGLVASIDLRLLGKAGRTLEADRLLVELERWAFAALLLALPTGALMFLTRASHYVANGPFRLKMLFLLLLGLNLLVVRRRLGSVVDRSPGAATFGTAITCSAGLSLFLWCATVFAGRWIGHS
ncbi:MAG: DUF6644 family protein [Acidobacteriota bacterium]